MSDDTKLRSSITRPCSDAEVWGLRLPCLEWRWPKDWKIEMAFEVHETIIHVLM